MFPGGLPRLSPAHYLANLEVILSLVFCPIPRQILREVFLTLPGEKNSYPKGGGMTRKTNQADVRVPSMGSPFATDALAEKGCFQEGAPGRPKSYSWHTNPFPGKFQKIWKYALPSVAESIFLKFPVAFKVIPFYTGSARFFQFISYKEPSYEQVRSDQRHIRRREPV